MIVAAVDIGNTRTHIGMVDIDTCICITQTAFPTRNMREMLLEAFFECSAKSSGCKITTVVISGVVADARNAAEKFLSAEGFTVTVLTASSQLPITLSYQTPQTLGADRIANAIYAAHLYPQATVVTVSAGSAVVIDCVQNKTFVGGVIFPGISLQLKALHEFTDALPLIAVPLFAAPSPPLPGTSTDSCILAGVLHGIAGGIQLISNNYVTRCCNQEPVVFLATGGAWPHVAPLISTPFIAVPDMTLIGTALSAKTTV